MKASVSLYSMPFMVSRRSAAVKVRRAEVPAPPIDVPEQAVHGVGGSVDDTLAFTRGWGFALATIRVPVLVTLRRLGYVLPGRTRSILGGCCPRVDSA